MTKLFNAERQSRRGVALVITLIMLAVITFMTAAFLVLSQRERNSVTTMTDQTTVRCTLESARERGLAELISYMMAITNEQVFGMIVSTNFINVAGFDTTFPLLPGANPYTNVNYDYTYLPAGIGPLTLDQRLRNLQHLLYNPRAPVYRTNRIVGGTENLFYHDLNRNGRFDGNGLLAVRNPQGGYYYTNGTFAPSNVPLGTLLISNFFIGDPEWIGVLEYPDRPHSPSNKFVARFAYLVVPASGTLDVNYIHNYARQLGPKMPLIGGAGGDGFSRNQGVGAFEINLGAFFTDLNTNVWGTTLNPYQYFDQNMAQANLGAGFDDAFAILRYRYRGDQDNLLRPLLGLDNPNIDEYVNATSAGAVPMDGLYWNDDMNDTGLGFPGADCPNHYFTIQDFFDPLKSSATVPGLVSRMRQASAGLSSYDSYTYYRMLEQLGTDSAPEPKLNVNYVNVDLSGRIVPGMETNFIPWRPIQFFTNAADRLLRAQFRRTSLTNIPAFTENAINYSPAVHRLLQLAANMHEATTNSVYPTMYRPLLSTVGTNIIISGYELVDPLNQDFLTPPLDLNDPLVRGAIPVYPLTTQAPVPNPQGNWYGIPWVVGAKKGLPNFNELAAQSVVQVTRRLQVIRASVTAPLSSYRLEQEFLIGISNVLGVEFWNSYHTNFTTPVQIDVTGDIDYSLTNSDNFQINNRIAYVVPSTNVTVWPGTGFGPLPAYQSFVVPLRTNFVILPPVAYRHSPPGFFAATNSAAFELIYSPPVSWGLAITNRIRIVMREIGTGRVLDYVQLNGPAGYRNLSEEIRAERDTDPVDLFKRLWNTNLTSSGRPQGIQNQIDISLGSIDAVNTDWSNYGLGQAAYGSTRRDDEIDRFRAFYHLVPLKRAVNNTNLVQQVPFTPTRIVSLQTSWQANDPLVHYLADDLNDPQRSGSLDYPKPGGAITNLVNIGDVNDRYEPWGGNPKRKLAPTLVDLMRKDPMVRSSDDWNFTTNKLPNIGWLGRIHRGTPWQTVYLKAGDTTRDPPQLKNWANWTGSTNGNILRAMAPVNDRSIFDLFTTAINENSVRGQLSINQPNLAAWSAVLSGVIVLTNTSSDTQVNANPPDLQFEPLAIQPAGVYDANLPAPVATIVKNINDTRNDTRQFPNKVFNRLGDILAVTNLTETSPFLNITNGLSVATRGIPDEVYERIPQQIMSLLTLNHTPRFVIYAYAQTLRPAEGRSVVVGGPNAGLCTNYQVTAESATRTVVRVEGSPDPRDDDDPNPARRYPPRVVAEQFNPLPPDM